MENEVLLIMLRDFYLGKGEWSEEVGILLDWLEDHGEEEQKAGMEWLITHQKYPEELDNAGSWWWESIDKKKSPRIPLGHRIPRDMIFNCKSEKKKDRYSIYWTERRGEEYAFLNFLKVWKELSERGEIETALRKYEKTLLELYPEESRIS